MRRFDTIYTIIILLAPCIFCNLSDLILIYVLIITFASRSQFRKRFQNGRAKKSCDKKCRHVGTNATRCGRYRLGCSIQIQHRKSEILNKDILLMSRLYVVYTSSHCCLWSLKQDVAAYIKKEFDKKFNPTWYVMIFFLLYINWLVSNSFYPPYKIFMTIHSS